MSLNQLGDDASTSTLPPPGSLAGLDEATETYERLKRERKVTATRLGGLRGDLERAKDQERAALARALKEDKAAPKLSKVEKIEKDIVVAEQRLAALEEAIDLATDDLIVVADDHREEWTETVLAEVAEAQTEYAEAVEASRLRRRRCARRSHSCVGRACFQRTRCPIGFADRTSSRFARHTETPTHTTRSSRRCEKTRR